MVCYENGWTWYILLLYTNDQQHKILAYSSKIRKKSTASLVASALSARIPMDWIKTYHWNILGYGIPYFWDTAIFSLRHHPAARLLEASVEAPSGASEASSAAAFGTSFTTRLCTFLVVVLVGATESRLKSREKGTTMRKDHCLNMLEFLLEFLLDILWFFYLHTLPRL